MAAVLQIEPSVFMFESMQMFLPLPLSSPVFTQYLKRHMRIRAVPCSTNLANSPTCSFAIILWTFLSKHVFISTMCRRTYMLCCAAPEDESCFWLEKEEMALKKEKKISFQLENEKLIFPGTHRFKVCLEVGYIHWHVFISLIWRISCCSDKWENLRYCENVRKDYKLSHTQEDSGSIQLIVSFIFIAVWNSDSVASGVKLLWATDDRLT